MLTIIVIMLTGVACGFLLKRHRFSGVSRLINILIWILLFLLGIEVGRDERIVNGLVSLGADALLISLFCTLGSCLAAWLLWKWSK